MVSKEYVFFFTQTFNSYHLIFFIKKNSEVLNLTKYIFIKIYPKLHSYHYIILKMTFSEINVQSLKPLPEVSQCRQLCEIENKL